MFCQEIEFHFAENLRWGFRLLAHEFRNDRHERCNSGRERFGSQIMASGTEQLTTARDGFNLQVRCGGRRRLPERRIHSFVQIRSRSFRHEPAVPVSLISEDLWDVFRKESSQRESERKFPRIGLSYSFEPNSGTIRLQPN